MKFKYNKNDGKSYTVVVTFRMADPMVFEAGGSMAEAHYVRQAVKEEMDNDPLRAGAVENLFIVPIEGKHGSSERLAVRERCAVRHGWDEDIEELDDFMARPYKGTLHDGTPFNSRLSSEDFKADELARMAKGGAA